MKKLLLTSVGLLQAACLMAAAPAHNSEKVVRVNATAVAQDANPAERLRPRRPWVLVAMHDEYMPNAKVPEKPQGKRAAVVEDTSKAL